MNTAAKLILFFFFLTNIVSAQSNVIFSVNSNPSINLGIKMQNIVFTFGTDFSYNYSKYEIEIMNSTSIDEYSVFSLRPGFGIKFYLNEDDFSPFIFANLSKEIALSVDVKGDTYSKKDIEDRYDDYIYRIGGGIDFSLEESLLIGFELGMNIYSISTRSSLIKSESLRISSLANVTMTYIFK